MAKTNLCVDYAYIFQMHFHWIFVHVMLTSLIVTIFSGTPFGTWVRYKGDRISTASLC